MSKVRSNATATPAPTRPVAAFAIDLPSSATRVPYDRSLYPHWIDEDGDCQDSREEVLIAESLVPAKYDARSCTVVSGLWFDPYIRQTFTEPRNLDVDHFIPLAEVHRSGGYAWTPEQRRRYTNDLSDSATLIAVSAASMWRLGLRSNADGIWK